MSTTLTRLATARAALAEVRSMDDILAIRDMAEAARVWAKAAKEGLATQNYAAEIKLRAERKAGELLSQMDKSKGTRGQFKGKVSSGDPIMSAPETVSPKLEEIGITHNQSSRWQKEAAVPEDQFERLIEECNQEGKELTQSALLKVAGAGHVSQATGENEWYTPPEWIETAREAMGEIDLDPASCEVAQNFVRAVSYFTIADDGLSREWQGRVWLNPPYSRELCGKFIGKLLTEYRAGNVTQACVLVNNATETAWMQSLLMSASAVCFPAGRISFLDRKGSASNKPLQGQLIAYLGDRQSDFRTAFEDFGCVLFQSFQEVRT